MSVTEQIFVYGTLRPPRPDTPQEDSRYYPRIETHVRDAVPARLAQAELFDLGTYPAARPGEGVVQGDLLTVEPAALAVMDRIEGHPHFFKREKVSVQTGAGPTRAWVYWAPKGLTLGRHRIAHGDWLRRDGTGAAAPEAANGPVDEELRLLVQRFANANCCWLSSVRPDGRAHSTPIWHVWHQGRAYIVTLANAVKTANILQNPSVVVTHPDPVDPVIIEGWATPAPAMQPQLQPLFEAKYNWDISTGSEYDTIIEITPTKLMAWGKHGQGRWPGAEVLRVWSV